jgi:hypothetical protein
MVEFIKSVYGGVSVLVFINEISVGCRVNTKRLMLEPTLTKVCLLFHIISRCLFLRLSVSKGYSIV